ncbi:MAG TPA: histidine kinase, partial [Rhodospirillaceae bacterium]|nr:histidine kinase [Rhodospirillaceae bacterium]
HFAIDVAAASALFVQFLAFNVQQMDVPLGIFGGFTTSHGRLNAKKLGLLPLVTAARAKAVRGRIEVTGTTDRYTALQSAGVIHPEDLTGLLEALETILAFMLEQQLADIDAGIKPSANVEPRKFPVYRQRMLKSAFQRIRTLKALMA